MPANGDRPSAGPPDPEPLVFPPRWEGDPVGSFPGSAPRRGPAPRRTAEPRLAAVEPPDAAPAPQRGAQPLDPRALPWPGPAELSEADRWELFAVELARVQVLLSAQRVELARTRALAWVCWWCAVALVAANVALLVVAVAG